MQPNEQDPLMRLTAQMEELPMADKMQLVQVLNEAVKYNADGADGGRKRRASAPPPEVRALAGVTFKIIGCAMAVHRKQGPGLRENTYQRDLEVHFTQAGLMFTSQKTLEVFDSRQGGKLVGYYVPDFIVVDKVVVEIKALGRLDDSHVAQVVGYLAVTGCPVGLLIDFGGRSLDWQRILPPTKVIDHAINRRWLFVPDWLRSNEEANPVSAG